jgi:acetoin utilization deacetylase AcuC-like enzyme
MKKPKVGVVYDEEMLLHRHHKEEHPERPERVMAIYLNLVKKKIWSQLVRIDAVPASDDTLALAHTQSHIQKVKDTLYNV